jgi:hypothetical protein
VIKAVSFIIIKSTELGKQLLHRFIALHFDACQQFQIEAGVRNQAQYSIHNSCRLVLRFTDTLINIFCTIVRFKIAALATPT